MDFTGYMFLAAIIYCTENIVANVYTCLNHVYPHFKWYLTQSESYCLSPSIIFPSWISRMIASTNGQMNLHLNTVQFYLLCSTKVIGRITISLSKEHKPI